MSAEDFKRKLTAVMSADVAGYSRLMAEDEAATVKTIAAYREVMASLIKQHRGRVVDSPGDNVLAEFASVVDAVQCAVAVQKEFQARNAELPENRRMEFRIGINLGDVIEEEDRIYGDGVNIAARLEALAEPGGICVSKTAFDHIESKLPLGYHYLGEQEVKNIPKPVGAYRVLMEPRVTTEGEKEEKPSLFRGRKAIFVGVIAAVVVIIALGVWRFYLTAPEPTLEPASEEKMAYPLPDKPSIAVLAFVNMSGDPEQEYFSDGLSEEIITTLSKVSDLLVIARQSTFSYKGKSVKISQVAEELGVRYVLEGSVRKSKDRVRVTAQLIDALAGHHLWAEAYDRELKDVLAIQGEITKEIITALEVKLTMGEQARLFAKGTDNVEAWALGAKAWKIYSKYSKENNVKAQELLERATKLDPHYPFLWIALANTHFVDARLAWTKSQAESLKFAMEFTEKTLSLDPENPLAHGLMGNIYLFQRQYEKAIAEGQRAISLGPNYADGYAVLSQIMRYSGRFEEALELIKKAMRLSPIHRAFYTATLAHAYLMLGRYEEAIPVSKQLIERWRRRECPPGWGHGALIMAYMELGREGEAKSVAEEFLKIQPTYSLEGVPKKNPYRDSAHLERMLSALRRAGLPETPPLPLPDKPSIAVLPFVNMSADPEQEYFSDGMTEEIITALSKTPKLFVIARTSTFRFKGKEVDVRKVGRELGVKYVLEGSVRKAEEKVRVTAQLVDAQTGRHLWAERYDRDLKNILALQDEITMKIVTAMQVNLTAGERARLWAKGTNNLEAYMKYLQAREHTPRRTKEDNAIARQIVKEAIALDPAYAPPYAVMALTHMMDIWLKTSDSPRRSIAQAIKLTEKSISMDDSLHHAHSILGWLYTMARQHDKGIAECERAVALAPNAADALFYLGLVLRYGGRHEEAVQACERGVRLSPFPGAVTFTNLGMTYFFSGRYEKAIEACKRAVRESPDSHLERLGLVAAYIGAGREEEARVAAEEVLRIEPKFSLVDLAKKLPYKNPSDKDRVIEAWRKAGLK